MLTIARVLQAGRGSGPGLDMEQSPRADLEEPDQWEASIEIMHQWEESIKSIDKSDVSIMIIGKSEASITW